MPRDQRTGGYVSPYGGEMTDRVRITDPDELRRIFNMPTATPEEQERARGTAGPLEQGQDTLSTVLDAAKRAIGLVNPVAGAGIAAGEAVANGEDILAAFNPIRWLAGGAGLALIIGGIIIAVK